MIALASMSLGLSLICIELYKAIGQVMIYDSFTKIFEPSSEDIKMYTRNVYKQKKKAEIAGCPIFLLSLIKKHAINHTGRNTALVGTVPSLENMLRNNVAKK